LRFIVRIFFPAGSKSPTPASMMAGFGDGA